MWEVEYTDEFGDWWNGLSVAEQTAVYTNVGLLIENGPNLQYPYSSRISRSEYTHMRELRIQYAGEPYRVLYAFDPRRTAILLIGGNKVGDNRWYEKYIPIADKLYELHIMTLKKEGLLNEQTV